MTLHLEAVSGNLVQLLHRLMAAEPLQQFYLVGGTALALHYGHRKSIDLDLFTHTPFDASKLNEFLNQDYGELLKHFDHQSLLNFYKKKYPHSSLWNLEKSLCYFDDAEHDPDPICLANQTWKQIKGAILAQCRIH